MIKPHYQLAKALGNSYATHRDGLALIEQLTLTQNEGHEPSSPGPGEEASFAHGIPQSTEKEHH